MKHKTEDYYEIAKLVDKGWGHKRIAQLYGVARTLMNNLVRRYKIHGVEGIINNGKKRHFTPSFKLEVIDRYYNGESISSLSVDCNINYAVITSWIKKYEQLGYNGLESKRGKSGKTRMGRPRKNNQENNNNNTATLTDDERKELNELRKRNKRLEMEIEATKKLNALVQERIERQTQKKRK